MNDTRASGAPPRRILEALAAGLEEIEAHFGWQAPESTEANTPGEDVLAPEVGDADEISYEGNDGDTYEEPYFTAGFDREEIEIAIDAFLSHLLERKLVRKNKSGSLPSFADVFATFFGDEHKIAKVADSFEDHIAGYFGWIDYENMKAAEAEFLEIQASLKRELGVYGGV